VFVNKLHPSPGTCSPVDVGLVDVVEEVVGKCSVKCTRWEEMPSQILRKFCVVQIIIYFKLK